MKKKKGLIAAGAILIIVVICIAGFLLFGEYQKNIAINQPLNTGSAVSNGTVNNEALPVTSEKTPATDFTGPKGSEGTNQGTQEEPVTADSEGIPNEAVVASSEGISDEVVTAGSEGISDEVVTADSEGIPEDAVFSDWVPFVVDNTEEFALEGFLYHGLPVEPASVIALAESGDNDALIHARIKENLPNYPLDQIPLLQPDMLVTADQNLVGNDASISIMYYTLSAPAETLAFYRNALNQFENFKEDIYDSSTGKSYWLSFTIPGEHKINASVMVMEMPETTGYTCAVNIHAAIRGINKRDESEEMIELRADGLPGNFPDNIIPVYQMKEINMSEGYANYCYVQFDSTATYSETVAFYRTKLANRMNFNESSDSEGEIYISFGAPGWSISVRIMDNEGNSYVEINCYRE